MSKTRANIVTVDIDEKLKSLSSTPSKPSMFRVGDAYDPEIIAIGPYHRRKPHLQNIQQHKLRYLSLLLDRREESSVERYVTTMRQLEDRARKRYAEDIDLVKDEFVKMLILDGSFIIEFLYMFQYEECRDKDDPIFQYEHMHSQLLHDLMVFENQIPFFIIDNLFNVIKRNNGDNLKSLIRPLLQNSIFPLQDCPEVPINAPHLLGIVHNIKCSSFANNSGNPNNMVNINSAEEHTEAGISFKKLKANRLFILNLKIKL